MLIALALLTQTATLDADPYVAARTCAVATRKANAGDLATVEEHARYMFYVMHAARARPEGQRIIKRVGTIFSAPLPEVQDGEVDGLIAQCDKRFPRLDRATAANLPTEPIDRDIMCLTALGVLHGGAEAVRETQPDDPWLDRLRAPEMQLMSRLNKKALERAGLAEDAALTEAYDRQIRASLELGDAVAVARACGVEGG